jgi:3-oxoacyl-[acyl-carrier-protein] synthase-1
MPGSAQTRALDPALASDYLLDGRATAVNRVVSNSFGFGGSNCSLVLERAA